MKQRAQLDRDYSQVSFVLYKLLFNLRVKTKFRNVYNYNDQSCDSRHVIIM